MSALSEIPRIGSGLGYRPPLREGILAAADVVDCLEVIAENYASEPRLSEVRELSERFTVIPHGVDLSIGSLFPLDREHLRAVRRVSDATGAPFYSEHLCLTRAPGIRLGHLSPLCFTEEVLRHTTEQVREVQDFLGKPLVLENVTYELEIPGAGMTQAEFFTRLVQATGCGILLDLQNVYVNSVNHAFDPLAFLDSMPLEHVVQVHLSGGYWRDDRLIDGHSEQVPEETWRLLEALARRVEVKASILEHDANFPDAEVLIAQVVRARELLGG